MPSNPQADAGGRQPLCTTGGATTSRSSSSKRPNTPAHLLDFPAGVELHGRQRHVARRNHRPTDAHAGHWMRRQRRHALRFREGRTEVGRRPRATTAMQALVAERRAASGAGARPVPALLRNFRLTVALMPLPPRPSPPAPGPGAGSPSIQVVLFVVGSLRLSDSVMIGVIASARSDSMRINTQQDVAHSFDSL